MAGISSKALNGAAENKRGFQGKESQSNEFSDGSGLEFYDFGARSYDAQIGRWGQVDPYSEKFVLWSGYVAMADNPLKFIDPNGKEYINFDKNGNYINSTKNNWLHNFVHGKKGRILNDKGKATQKFSFADPKNDVASIKSGVINKVVFVQESEVAKMVSDAGGFTHGNKTENRSLFERYSYIRKEGEGGQKMDFSYSAIPKMYEGASDNPLQKPSPMLFLINGTAHNHMNFGNFLFGATGEAIGFSLLELKTGAHYNSLRNPDKNGYGRQIDSYDDQLSIRKGFNFARRQNYDNKEWKVTVHPLESITN